MSHKVGDYPVEIEFHAAQEGGYYFAWLPAFGQSACSATGDTEEEALKTLEEVTVEVIAFYKDIDRPIPAPDSIPEDVGKPIPTSDPHILDLIRSLRAPGAFPEITVWRCVCGWQGLADGLQIHPKYGSRVCPSCHAMSGLISDAFERGVYRHYKGNTYEVLGVAEHTETHEMLVYYCRTDGDDRRTWARPLPMFVESVLVDNARMPRFKRCPKLKR